MREVDRLADIAKALRGERRVRTQVVLARLAAQQASEYESWTFGDLRAALAAHGIPSRKSDGRMVVRLEDVIEALAEKREDLGVKPGQSDSSCMLGWVLVVVTIAVAFGLVAALLLA